MPDHQSNKTYWHWVFDTRNFCSTRRYIKSCLKLHCKTMCIFFAASSEKEIPKFLPFHWPCLQPKSCCSNCQIWLVMWYNTWLSHLSTSRIFFSKDRCLNRCNIPFAKSLVEDCLELNFKYVDYQTLAHLSCNSYVCWTSEHATRVQRFLSVQASISPSSSICSYSIQALGRMEMLTIAHVSGLN